MEEKNRYEILEHLPAYGQMYIPISRNDEPFFSEGFVVRFLKSDGTDWIANFQSGPTSFNRVFDFPDKNVMVIIAGGYGYIMNKENEIPLGTFGWQIDQFLQTENGTLVFSDSLIVTVLDNSNGQIWNSERISWDGIKDLTLKENILSGKSYDPTSKDSVWRDFSLNLETKEIKGGSYREALARNPNMKKITVDSLRMKPTAEKPKKPWWKFW